MRVVLESHVAVSTGFAEQGRGNDNGHPGAMGWRGNGWARERMADAAYGPDSVRPRGDG